MKTLLIAFLLALSLAPAAQAAPARDARPAQPKDAREMTVDEYLASAGLVIDKNFSTYERRDLARGLHKIPACFQKKIRGLKIKRVTGVKYYGQRVEGSDFITINPKHYPENPDFPDEHYDRKNGAFVHEVFHVIGEWNNDYYYKAYLKLDSEGDCPVSRYGEEADVVQEDFAEAARLIFVPETRDDRNRDTCVDRKLAALKKIFAECK